MPSRLAVPLAIILSAIVLMVVSTSLPHAPKTRFAPPEYPQGRVDATGGTRITTSLDGLPSRNVHAFHAIAVGSDIYAVWYGGYKESARDTAIYLSRYQGTDFQQPRVILNSDQVQRALGRHNQTLGNPVLWQQDGGRLWLWVVSVAVGGWSNSSLVVSYSDNLGEDWSPPRQLYTSPFINIATLGKSNPINMTKGLIALPVYHELFSNHSELLLFDRSMRVIDKRRIGWSDGSVIQPSLMVLDSDHAIALQRSMDKTRPAIHLSTSSDGGNSFTDPMAINLPNPDASVHAIGLSADLWLLAYNHRWSDRHTMDLAVSHNLGGSWRQLTTIQSLPDGRLGYPWLVATSNGIVHLFYTFNRTSFIHHQFDRNWLQAQSQ